MNIDDNIIIPSSPTIPPEPDDDFEIIMGYLTRPGELDIYGGRFWGQVPIEKLRSAAWAEAQEMANRLPWKPRNEQEIWDEAFKNCPFPSAMAVLHLRELDEIRDLKDAF